MFDGTERGPRMMMKSRLMHACGITSLVPMLLASCSEDRAIDEPSIETLASAIRAVGYACGNVVDSSDIATERRNWRVACDGARTYAASLSNDGNICITPIPYVDAVVPAPIQTTPQRCVSTSDI